MNKKGYTLVEILAVMTILLVIIFFAVRTFSKSFERNRIKTFLSEALIIAEGARNRYQDDRMQNIVVHDIYQNNVENKTCYLFETALKNKYVTKYSSKYVGSVEVCHDTDCDYETKIWLTNGEFYLNGVISDNTLTRSSIDKKFNDDKYLTCGTDISSYNLAYDFDYTNKEDKIMILRDGIYSLEAWGAQGGNAGVYHGGYGGYAYTEMEFHVGDILYINVGGEGDFANSDPTPKGGYNGGGSGDWQNGSGGGATSIATKSGLISKPILQDYLLVVAGGGGGGKKSSGCCQESTRIGYSGGGYVDEANTVGQSGYNYGKGTGSAGNGGGYHGFDGSSSNVGRGGSGFIGHALTNNGVMYGYNVPESSAVKTKTIKTTNVSMTPTPKYAKQGNGYAKITLINDYFISYDLKGGTVSAANPTSYSKSASTITLNNPTKDAYTFTGWTGTNGSTPQTSITIPSGSTGNRSYVANYTPINYSVTYNLNGGTLGDGVTNPTSYNVETATFTLKNPTKEGYKFVGWTGSNGETPQLSVSVSNGSTGNKTYTAVFEKAYAVTLDYNISSYTFPSDGTLMNTGLVMDFDEDFIFDMNVVIPTSGKRYLLLGNYDTSVLINVEITTDNKLRVYQGGDRAVSDAVTIGEDARILVNYTSSDKSFTSSYKSASSDVSKSGTLVQSGWSTSTLKAGQDNRGGATFTGFTLKGLKITSGIVNSKLPSSVTLPGSTFAGWYTSPTGGNRVTSASTLSDGMTLYAHWN